MATMLVAAAGGVALLNPAGAFSTSRAGPAPIRCVKTSSLREDPPPPCPIEGQTVDVARLSGVVTVTLPGQRPVVLDEPHEIPVGTIVDAAHGRYRLTADEHGAGIPRATSDFYGGSAQVLQGSGRNATLDMRLVDARCATGALAAAHSHHAVSHLWGNGKGHFQISGQYASAVVRGTYWNLTDYCDGSGVTVRRGVVAVNDFATGQTVLVGAGHSVFAPSTATFVFPTSCPSAPVALGTPATITGTFSPPQLPAPPQVDYRAPSGALVTHTLHLDAAGNFSDQVTTTERGIWTVTVHLAAAQGGGVPASCSFSVS